MVEDARLSVSFASVTGASLVGAMAAKNVGTKGGVRMIVMSRSMTRALLFADAMLSSVTAVVLLFQVGRLLTAKIPATCAMPEWEARSSNIAMVRCAAVPEVSSMSSTWVVRVANSFVAEIAYTLKP